MKKDANPLQALVDRYSEATGTGGFVSLLTVANMARALLLFLVIMSWKKDCLDFFKIQYSEDLLSFQQYTQCTVQGKHVFQEASVQTNNNNIEQQHQMLHVTAKYSAKILYKGTVYDYCYYFHEVQ